MDWMNLFLNALNAYLAVWIAKSILVLADVHVAAAVTTAERLLITSLLL